MATWHGISKDPQSSCDSRNHSSLRENCREKSRIGHRIIFFLTCSTPPGVLCDSEQYKAKIEQAIHSWIQDTSIWLRVYMQGPLAAIHCKCLWRLFGEANCGAIANLDIVEDALLCYDMLLYICGSTDHCELIWCFECVWFGLLGIFEHHFVDCWCIPIIVYWIIP